VAVGFIEGGNWRKLPTFSCSHGQNLSYKFNLVHLIAYQNQTHNLVSKGTEYNQVVTVWESVLILSKNWKNKKIPYCWNSKREILKSKFNFCVSLVLDTMQHV